MAEDREPVRDVGMVPHGECTAAWCGHGHGAKCFNAGRCLMKPKKSKPKKARPAPTLAEA